MSVRLASESLSGCSGCEMSLLNVEGGFLSLLRQFEVVHMPLLMDNKYFGRDGTTEEVELPSADIGIISGGIRTEEQLRIAEKMRERCKVIVAFGTCAAYGGIATNPGCARTRASQATTPGNAARSKPASVAQCV